MSNWRRIFHSQICSTGVFALRTVTVIICGGCSLAINTDQVQCVVDADCQRETGAMPGGTCVVGLCEVEERWQCLNGPVNDETVAQETQSALPRVELYLPINSLDLSSVGQSDNATVELSLCRNSDIQCESPLKRETIALSNPLSFDLEAQFQGYIQLRAPGMIPVLYFLNPPYRNLSRLSEAELMSDSRLNALMDDLNLAPADQGGMVKVSAHDCLGNYAAGVSYSLTAERSALESEDLQLFYEVGGVPSLLATVTDTSGRGGFFNVPAGPLSVEASMGNGVSPLGGIGFLVRKGSITYANIDPRRNYP